MNEREPKVISFNTNIRNINETAGLKLDSSTINVNVKMASNIDVSCASLVAIGKKK